MGLDNIPAEYPCIVEGFQPEGKQINCERMIKRNMCPWDREMGNEKGGILGMFGTPCWYRGKAGNYMLLELENKGYIAPISFYGSGDDGNETLSPKECLDLSEWMADHADDIEEEGIDEYWYAIKWLKFVSEYDGSRVWY